MKLTISGSRDSLMLIVAYAHTETDVHVGEIIPEPHELPITYELDYDWKNPEGSSATGTVTINSDATDEEARALLIKHDDDISDEFGQEYVSFEPTDINGLKTPSKKDIPKNERKYSAVVQACLHVLRTVPGTREFTMEGDIG